MLAIDLDLCMQAVVLEQHAGWVVSIAGEAHKLIGGGQHTQTAIDLVDNQTAINDRVLRRVFVRALIKWEV